MSNRSQQKPVTKSNVATPPPRPPKETKRAAGGDGEGRHFNFPPKPRAHPTKLSSVRRSKVYVWKGA